MIVSSSEEQSYTIRKAGPSRKFDKSSHVQTMINSALGENYGIYKCAVSGGLT